METSCEHPKFQQESIYTEEELKQFEEQFAKDMGWGDHAYPLPPGHQQPPPITPRMLVVLSCASYNENSTAQNQQQQWQMNQQQQAGVPQQQAQQGNCSRCSIIRTTFSTQANRCINKCHHKVNNSNKMVHFTFCFKYEKCLLQYPSVKATLSEAR